MSNTKDNLPEFNSSMFDDINNMLDITTEATGENPTTPATPKGLDSVGTSTLDQQPTTTQPQPTEQKKPDYDFEIMRLNNKVTFPNGSTHYVPKKQSFFRKDTGDYLGSCSPSYNLVKHSHAVELLKEAANRTGLQYTENHTTTKDGARLFYNLRFDGQENKIEGEKIAPQIVMINTYDGSAPFDLDLGAYRFVCSNGMRVGKSLERTRVRHTASLNVEDIVKKIELKLNSYTKVFVPFCNALAEYEANHKDGIGIIEGIADKTNFPKRHTESVLEQWNRPRTAITGGQNAWGIYNAFTNVITHDIQSESFERGHELNGQIMTGFEQLVSN